MENEKINGKTKNLQYKQNRGYFLYTPLPINVYIDIYKYIKVILDEYYAHCHQWKFCILI